MRPAQCERRHKSATIYPRLALNCDLVDPLRDVQPIVYVYAFSQRTVMWLPGPIYEALPYAYVVGGALFVCGTLYADPPAPMNTLYLTLGVVSVLSGILVFVRRRGERERKRSSD